jgi:signal transduction histidine kinase/CheY-like chemotaxis protein/ligand-binding sensor domain-containing protein
MKVRLFLTFALVLAALVPVIAQGPAPDHAARLKGQPVFRPFTNNSGLAQKTIRKVVRDTDGRLWVSSLDSANGLAYLSGERWVSVQVPGCDRGFHVHSLLAGSDGSLWVGHDKGVSHLRNGVWESFTPPGGAVNTLKIQHFAEDRRPDGKLRIWMSREDGIYRLDPPTGAGESPVWMHFGPFIAPNVTVKFSVLLVGQDRRGDSFLWVGTLQSGLARFDGRKWEVFDRGNSGIPSDSIRCLLETSAPDGKRILWVGTDNGGIARFDGETWQSSNTRTSPLPNNSVQALATTVDATGAESLWVGTYGGGLVRVGLADQKLGPQWDIYTLSNSTLPNDIIWTLLADPRAHRQSLWIGTESGLVRFSEGQWLTVDTRSSPLPKSSVYSFLETKTPDGRNVLWMGTRNGGIVRWTGPSAGKSDGEWKRFDIDNTGLFHDRVTRMALIHEPDGQTRVWAASFHEGLAIFENERWRLDKLPKFESFGPFIRTLLETRGKDGTYVQWAGTRDGGLLKRVNGRWERITKGTDGFPSNAVWALVEADVPGGGDRTVWAATGSGVTYLKDNRWITFTHENSKLPVGFQNSLLETTGTDGRHFLWISSMTSGAIRLDLSETEPKWLTFDVSGEKCLPTNFVYGLATDRLNGVYFCTQNGVVRLIPKGQRQDTLADYDLQLFTTEDGLASDESNLNATLLDGGGRILTGTVSGVSIFNPVEYIPPPDGNPLVLEQAVFGPENTRLQDGGVLAHDENMVRFTFSLLQYYRASATRYRFQLVGLDPQPSPWTATPAKEYTNLGAGRYTFKVWAKDVDGHETGPTSISFTVRNAPWRSLPAYLLYGVVLLIGAYLLLRGRTLALHRLNDTLESRVTERTAELAKTIALLQQAQAEVEIKNEQLRHSQKMETVGQLAGGIAHNFNNILAIIVGYSELLLNQTPADAATIRPLKAIDKAAKRGRDLVRKLMSFSRKADTRPEVIDLNASVLGTISIVEQIIGSRCILETRIDQLPAAIRIDRQELEQAFLNLFINARDAMPRGGTIRVSTERVTGGGTVPATGRFVRYTKDGRAIPDANGQFPSLNGQNFICLSVGDSGVGMNDDVLEHLFEPFFTTKEEGKGTGLGLATVFGGVTRGGGFIEVESAVGVGTVFRLYFPLIEDPGAALSLSGSGKFDTLAIFRGNSETILLVEDEPEVREFITQALESSGYRVLAAENGQIGLERFRANSDRIALVLTDVIMPGLGGLELAKTIRLENRMVPIISMSGNDDPPTSSSGIRTHLDKPFTAKTLLQAVKYSLTGVLQ